MKNFLVKYLNYVVAFLLVLTLFSIYKFHNDLIENQTEKLSGPYKNSGLYISNWIGNLKSDTGLTPKQVAIFKIQNSVIAARKNYHLSIAKYFLANYYATILLLMISTISVAILIFLIVSKGWEAANNYLKTFFFVFFFMSTFWGLFPIVFGQKENYENNFQKYLEYDKLQIKLFNYLSNNSRLDLDLKTRNADTIITLINKDIYGLSNLIITIDASKIKTAREISDELSVFGPK